MPFVNTVAQFYMTLCDMAKCTCKLSVREYFKCRLTACNTKYCNVKGNDRPISSVLTLETFCSKHNSLRAALSQMLKSAHRVSN